MADLATFNRQLDRFLEQTGIDFVTFQKKVSFDIFRGVVQKTPVDTGWAQNNWNISVGSVDLTVTPKPEGSGSPGGFDALRKMEDVDIDRVGEIVYISNNLGYITYLEQGSSDRAPNGMVRVTVAEVETNVNTLLRGV